MHESWPTVEFTETEVLGGFRIVMPEVPALGDVIHYAGNEYTVIKREWISSAFTGHASQAKARLIVKARK
jgi:hypothetical protein